MLKVGGIIRQLCGCGYFQRFCDRIECLCAFHHLFNFLEHDPPVLEDCVELHEQLNHFPVRVTAFYFDFDATIERLCIRGFIIHVAHLDEQFHHPFYCDGDFRLGKAIGKPYIGLLVDNFIVEGGEIVRISGLTLTGVYQQWSRRAPSHIDHGVVNFMVTPGCL